MVFKGIYPARELTPTPCGLLSVASVSTHTTEGYNHQWLRGYSFEYNSNPLAVRVGLGDGVTISGATLHTATDFENFSEISPFFIEVDDKHSGMGLVGQDRFDIVEKQLIAVTQKAVEYELWEGVVAEEQSITTPYLTKAGDATVVTTAGSDPRLALLLLEQAISNSPTGSSGVIHMTRDVASSLGNRIIFDLEENSQARTRLGTPISIGSGYTGAGPDGESGATPSATNKWMFATGPVVVHLGEPEIDNENLGQGFNSATNDSTVRGTRAAAVEFDPSILYAAQVTIPTFA